jgi:hypothetical protein
MVDMYFIGKLLAKEIRFLFIAFAARRIAAFVSVDALGEFPWLL